MKLLIAMTAATTILAVSTSNASAQYYGSFYSGGHFDSPQRTFSSHRASHDYGQHHRHSPDMVCLTNLVGEMGEVCRHLHEDAHNLSQDYRNSEAIEVFIHRLDRLKIHMHELLTDAARRGLYSSSLDRHIKQDVAEVQQLLSEFYRHIQDQAFEGVRPCDHKLLVHMEEIVVHEAFPLLCRIETQLYGRQISSGLPTRSHERTSHYQPQVRYEPQPQRHLDHHQTLRPATPPVPPVLSRLIESGRFPGGPGSIPGRPVVRFGPLRIQF